MQVDLEQGSLEWHEHRLKHRNASEAGIIMDCVPKSWGVTKRKLWEQKNGLIGAMTKTNPAMTHGNNLEPIARACVEKKLKAQLEPATFVKGDYSASIDGYGPDSTGQPIKVEIKCPFAGESSETWKMAASGNIEEHYRWQMVHQEYVEPTVQSWFFVYISDKKNILLPFVSSDDETQQLLAAWDDFCANEPAPDWMVMEDEHMRLLVNEHKSLLAKKTQIDDHLKQVEKAIKERAGDNNVSSFGCKIQTIERKGSVDYSKIDAIKDADLEQFRKPSTTYQKISYAKGE